MGSSKITVVLVRHGDAETSASPASQGLQIVRLPTALRRYTL